jgi:isoleucyl-tRNA synthetase
MEAEFKAKDLVGLHYEPLFPYYKDTQNAFRTVLADFVTLEEGTGIVHIAPAFGEDDYQIGQREQIPFIQHVTMEGKFTPEVTDFANLPVKPKDKPLTADIEILKYLETHDSLFRKINVTHTYPHCWRCDSPLINYATNSWFVDVTKIKQDLLENNQKINWVPSHIKNGRFGKWLENARDWAITRNRYWGTPLPVWKSEDGDLLCIGSIQELEQLSGKKVTDLHKEVVDDIFIQKDGKTYHRIPEVLDCWFESGAMPYASFHYPFENKDKFEASFPAAFISEGQDQTRGWFYTLHVLATALTFGDNPAIKIPPTSSFQNVICSGIVLAEDGKKMSKRLNNYPDPMLVADKYGVDALRLYLASSPVVRAENLNFSEKEVDEIRRKVINILLNILSFYSLYPAKNTHASSNLEPMHIMDRWLISRLENTTQTVTQKLEAYDLVSATRNLMGFVDEFSTWWLRSSRDRIRTNQDNVMMIFSHALKRTAILIAPFAPFVAEHLYQTVTRSDNSVHLADWITADISIIDYELEIQMAEIRKAAEKIHGERKFAGIPTRQPLSASTVSSSIVPSQELKNILALEVNVAQIDWQHAKQLSISLDTNLTPKLKAEGEAREIIRKIQDARKAIGTGLNDPIKVILPSWPAEFEAEIKTKVKAVSITQGDTFEIKPCSG